jgi:hypothetical protein
MIMTGEDRGLQIKDSISRRGNQSMGISANEIFYGRSIIHTRQVPEQGSVGQDMVYKIKGLGRASSHKT